MTFEIQIAIISGYAIFLFYWGMKKKPTFSSWHMFANLNRVKFNLYYKDIDSKKEELLNPWEFLPHTYVSINKIEAEFFLEYLKEVYEIDVNGEIEVWKNFEYNQYKVENNELVY